MWVLAKKDARGRLLYVTEKAAYHTYSYDISRAHHFDTKQAALAEKLDVEMPIKVEGP